ncbi:MAG: hypothetical protein KKD73_06070 [Proteobacteria bacterium]|nr:hypothetical protein [Pseudomonadota bacterium]MBU1641374.1 hypothetical protein [Pseudomonadota bacterium]
MKRYASVAEMLPSLRTGDIMLAHGTEWVSEAIEIVEASEWSHVCMIVQARDIGLDSDQLLIWESSDANDLPDVITGQIKPGPMLVDAKARIASDYIEHTDDKFAIRRFLFPDFPTIYAGALRSVIDAVHATDRGFPCTLDLARDLVKGRFHNQAATDNNYFCSELVAHTLMEIGLISRNYVPNAYTPADFQEINASNVPWIELVKLSEDTLFKKS